MAQEDFFAYTTPQGSNGEFFQQVRARAGLSQAMFWGHIGVCQTGGSYYEARGGGPLPVMLLFLIAYGTEGQAMDALAWLRGENAASLLNPTGEVRGQALARPPARMFCDAKSIVCLRKKLCLSQKKFWARVGMSQNSGSEYEAGKLRMHPQAPALLQLAYGTQSQVQALWAWLRKKQDSMLKSADSGNNLPLKFNNPEGIRARRHRVGISQQQFWGKVMTSQASASRYEAGERVPQPVQMLFHIVHGSRKQALDVLVWLRGGQEIINSGTSEEAWEHDAPGERPALEFNDAESVFALRKGLNLCQGKFWGRVGLSQRAGSRYESGGARLPRQAAVLLQLAYGSQAQAQALWAWLRKEQSDTASGSTPPLRFRTAKNIRVRRQQLGFSQRKFWGRIGVTQGLGSHYEAGSKPLPVFIQVLLHCAYGPIGPAADFLDWLRAS